MKRTWLVAAGLAAAIATQAQECRPGIQMLTVYTLSKTLIPNDVMARAKYMATRVLAGAGVTVEWVKGERPADSEKSFCGDWLAIAFEAKAPSGFVPQALAYANLNAGSSTEIHIFYDRVSVFPDRLRMAEYLGHVLAHEIAHVLQGVARHSSEGVMKARWNALDCSEMARKPLGFTAEDVELITAHFRTRMAQGEKVEMAAGKEKRE
jgi:hypothetical protein